MVTKSNLTHTRVSNFKCDDGKSQSFLWDADAPGLGLRVTASGKKTYIFQSKIAGLGIDPRVPIGDPATWRLSEARELARKYKVMTDSGLDPRQVNAAKQEAQAAADAERSKTASRDALTLRAVWPIYLADRKRKWSDGHYKNHVNLAAVGGEPKKRGTGLTVAGPLAPLMKEPLSALTSDRIAEWLHAESAVRATNAAQSFRILKAFATWAEDFPAYSGIIASNAFTSRKVRDAVPQSLTKEGDCLERQQLAKWFNGVREIDSPVVSTYLLGLLLTGARRNELAELKWADVDFTWKKLILKDKVEGNRTIPLTPYFSELLLLLPRHQEWVFSSLTSASGHITSPTKAHQRALTSADLPHVSLHGLRRTFGTMAERVDVPAGVAAQIMGHKPSALAEKYYIRRTVDDLRDWHVKIEAWILREANIEWTT